jgi:hypothetical protein
VSCLATVSSSKQKLTSLLNCVADHPQDAAARRTIHPCSASLARRRTCYILGASFVGPRQWTLLTDSSQGS